MELHRESTAFHQYLLKDLQYLSFHTAVQHRILHRYQHFIVRRILDSGRLQGVVLDMTVFPKFLQNTFFIDIHQLFRIVLGRKFKFFVYFYRQVGIRKQLLFNLLFRGPDICFLNQTGTF